MRVKLRISTFSPGESSSHTETFEVTKDSCTLGRRGADVVLTDPSCSRRHAMLYQGMKGELRLMDLHSTNGTFLNEERVIDRPIAVGATFRIASLQITVDEFAPKGRSLETPAHSAPQEDEVTETQTVIFQPLTLDAPAKIERPIPPPLRK